MDNYQRNYFTDEELVSLSQPQYKSESEPDSNPAEITPHVNKHPVLTFQLVVVLCVLLFLFIIKFSGSALFDDIINWYKTAVSESVIYNGNSDSFDYSQLFATEDEI